VKKDTIQPGSVLAAPVGPDGSIFMIYLGHHGEYGDCVKVAARVHQTFTEPILERSVITFYPARAAARRGMVRTTGARVSVEGVPRFFRRAFVRDESGVSSWMIQDMETGAEVLRQRDELSASERALPIVALWNHAYLVETMQAGWPLPEDE